MPNRIAKLGDRLRKISPPRSDDLDALCEYRCAHIPALREAASAVAETTKEFCGESAQSARLKNTGTIIEKMVRDKTSLARMQDIAGLRVVLLKGSAAEQRKQQRSLARAIQLGVLQDRTAQIDDLISSPSSGYRAVHVIGRCRDQIVEIQIRTRLQHMWAEIYERMADLWGRQIRYPGGQPAPNSTALVDGVTLRAEDVLDTWQCLSTRIMEKESGEDIHLDFSEKELDAFQPAIPETLASPMAAMDFRANQWALVTYRRTAPAGVMQWDWVDIADVPVMWRRLDELYRLDLAVEVVLICSDSYRSVRVTHARYLKRSLWEDAPPSA